jgi:hypothetical protein
MLAPSSTDFLATCSPPWCPALRCQPRPSYLLCRSSSSARPGRRVARSPARTARLPAALALLPAPDPRSPMFPWPKLSSSPSSSALIHGRATGSSPAQHSSCVAASSPSTPSGFLALLFSGCRSCLPLSSTTTPGHSTTTCLLLLLSSARVGMRSPASLPASAELADAPARRTPATSPCHAYFPEVGARQRPLFLHFVGRVFPPHTPPAPLAMAWMTDVLLLCHVQAVTGWWVVHYVGLTELSVRCRGCRRSACPNPGHNSRHALCRHADSTLSSFFILIFSSTSRGARLCTAADRRRPSELSVVAHVHLRVLGDVGGNVSARCSLVVRGCA